MTKRILRFDGIDKEFELERVTAIKHDIPTIFTLEVMKNGKFRLTYNAIAIPDLSKVSGITIVRED